MASKGTPFSEAMMATNMTSAAKLRRTVAGKPKPCFYRSKSSYKMQQSNVCYSLHTTYEIFRKRFTAPLRLKVWIVLRHESTCKCDVLIPI